MSYKYSIIVPMYNVEKYIDECIKSIINQTYKNIEIIFVDDGSPDNCASIVKKYTLKDNRIQLIRKNNGGLVSARKSGAKIATGDYICCVDGDDYLDLNYIEEFNKILTKKNYDIVCFGFHKTMENGLKDVYVNAPAGEYDKNKLENRIFPYLIQDRKGKYFLPTVWAKAFKRELYLEHQMRVPDDISMGEDGACTIPCIINSDLMYVSEKCLYYYRFNPTSMTKSKRALDWQCQINIARHLSNAINLDSYDFQEQYYRRVEKGFFIVLKSQFNRDEDYNIIKREILDQMNNPIFSNAIQNANFDKGLRMRIIDFALKHHMIFLFKIIGKV
ncbi:glycosyltransferase family 2 protein [Coprobacillus sp. AF36-10BH]|nr:glycosyltransferase family 2 protein [Coprobacillus sp. AF36-10BH]